MATHVRTKYADQLFQPKTAAVAIDDRAFAGHRDCRLVQELPFDLSDTEAAKALEIWHPTFIEQDPLSPSIGTEYSELVITW